MTVEERLAILEDHMAKCKDHIHLGTDFKQISAGDIKDFPATGLSYAKAYLNGAQSLTNDGNDHKILLDTQVAASGITFGSNKFTTLTTGKYLIITKIYLNSVPDQGSIRVKIYKNGAAVSNTRITQSLSAGSNDFSAFNVGFFVASTVGDYFEFYAASGDGGSYTIQTGEGSTEMEIIKIA